MAEDRLLIVGLGNPGSKYEKTRHNAGFIAIDHFAAELGESVGTEKMQGLYTVFRQARKQVFLLKPQTYMNRSGECIIRYVRYFDIQPEHILVIHDDLDLDPGRIKIVARGGAGGHKGIGSAIQYLGTPEFCRIKIGIGRPAASGEGAGIPVEKYVLSRFSDEQWQFFAENLDNVAAGIRLFIDQGIDAAMNRINALKKPDPAGK
ncbi:MAG: aminoacyl-tRNA hydrolase [Desulfobulbaceae bacterium]|nr:aminoacyl-tRNA hydrolase [Desulfobulbaceae bacterium]